jgi:16S rRNA processing protein RimM
VLLVGRVTKAHGLRGEVVVDLLSTEPEVRLATGSVLATERGPLTVEAARPHQERWIVRFEGVLSREAAEALRGTELRADAIDDPDALWVHELEGAEVVEVDGTPRGRVVAVLANPADDLLELEGGALVPVGFVLERDAEGRIVVEVPDGLFDLGS